MVINVSYVHTGVFVFVWLNTIYPFQQDRYICIILFAFLNIAIFILDYYSEIKINYFQFDNLSIVNTVHL